MFVMTVVKHPLKHSFSFFFVRVGKFRREMAGVTNQSTILTMAQAAHTLSQRTMANLFVPCPPPGQLRSLTILVLHIGVGTLAD